MRFLIDKIPYIIVITAIVVLGIIIRKMIIMPPEKRYKAWIAIVIVAILLGSLMFFSGSWRKRYYDTYRYDTVEEMVQNCMPGDTIDYVLYYDKYAIVFLNDTDDEAMRWYPTMKDDNGWKGVDIYNVNSIRMITSFYKGDFKFIEVDRESGLDFVAYYLNVGNEHDLLGKINDTNGSEFKCLELPSGDYTFWYTFTDVDKPGYEITINEKTLKMDEIEFKLFPTVFDYRWLDKN